MGVLKLGGIASGLDTEGLIKQLISLERRPMATMDKRKEQLSTEANAWRDLNSRLLNLKSRLTDLKNLGSSVWSAKKATVGDASILSASAGSTAFPGTYTVDVLTLATTTTWESGLVVANPTADLGQAGTMTVAGGPGNGKTIDVVATDSLQDIAAKMNANSALGFTAGVIQVNPGDYRLVLSGKAGAANDFSLTDTVGTVANFLQLDAGTGIKVTNAANGSIKVNGVAITVGSNSPADAIPGVTLTLLKPGTSTVSLADDQSKAVDAAKQFVDQYNSTVEFIASLQAYDPKEKKGGALLGEAMVGSIQNALNQMATEAVPGLPVELQTLSQVGIASEKFVKDGKASRKLVFNETKFRAALSKDPAAVSKLFTLNDGASKGVAVKLEEWLSNYTKSGGLVLSRAETLDSAVQRIKDRITYFDEVILPQKEKRFRAQFIALEKAMSTMQGQGQWLSSQLGSLNQK